MYMVLKTLLSTRLQRTKTEKNAMRLRSENRKTAEEDVNSIGKTSSVFVCSLSISLFFFVTNRNLPFFVHVLR